MITREQCLYWDQEDELKNLKMNLHCQKALFI